MTLVERFWKYVDKTESCWNWTGYTSKGYGRIWNDDHSRLLTATRAVLKLVGREVPAGMQVDHLCRNTLCVNPAHLEVVSQWENIARSEAVGAYGMRHNRCKRGHDWSLPASVYVRPNGTRRCRACALAYNRQRRERRKAA